MTAYRGRFAPSPTGPLHFGSLVAALASYLDARHHDGIWLLRMEDLDVPRCMPGAAEDILQTLAAFGLESDEPVIYQSSRTSAYEAALHKLQKTGAAYPCSCTRREIADSALHGIEGPVYPGACRNGIAPNREGKAWRVRTDDDAIAFADLLQGTISQHLESEIGDFVIRRADHLFAYQLAVVIDDAAQGITHVVRGADLLHSTPRQMHLQKLLGLPTPSYMHLPIAVNAAGEKLSKQALAKPVEKNPAALFEALLFLRQQPPEDLRSASIGEILSWAKDNWQPEKLSGCRQIAV
jgi:glutamyl-Q tRNA(Asp) synthetase